MLYVLDHICFVHIVINAAELFVLPTGVPVYFCFGWGKFRVDEACDSVHQKRPHESKPRPHQPGPPLHG